MQKIITKSLTNIALASAVALPFIASSAYGGTTTQTNSRSIDSSDSMILASANTSTQAARLCEYDKNIDLKVPVFINSCMKAGTLAKIHLDLHKLNLIKVKKLALGTYTSKDFAALNGSDKAKRAYAVLTNKANLRDPSTWAK